MAIILLILVAINDISSLQLDYDVFELLNAQYVGNVGLPNVHCVIRYLFCSSFLNMSRQQESTIHRNFLVLISNDAILFAGLVSKIFPVKDVVNEAIKLGDKIGKNSKLITQLCKEAVNTGM